MARGLTLIVGVALALIAIGWVLASTVLPGALLVIGPIAILGVGLGTMFWKRRFQRRKAAALNR